MSTTPIENLVFEGGGTKGAAYAGCMQVMDHLDLLKDVKRVAGTSAGSITATLLACGCGSDGITKVVHDTDFRNFIFDKGGFLCTISRFLFRYGMHSGDPLVKKIKKYIKQFGGNEELTFSQLDELALSQPEKYKQLTIVASNVTTQKPEIFNSKKNPNLPIWKAVRASVSIPVIFEPINIDGDLFVDGGLSWIFPIDIYDTVILKKENGDEYYERNPATLGFYLEQQNLVKKGKDYNPPMIKIDSLKSFYYGMFGFLLENANADHLHPDDIARTVFIDDLGVSGTSFTTSPEMIEKLIVSGYDATIAYFEIRNK